MFSSLVSGGNTKLYTLKQTYSFQLQICLSMYDLLLSLGIRGLSVKRSILHNPFQASILFLYPLKRSDKQRFSYVLRGYKKDKFT